MMQQKRAASIGQRIAHGEEGQESSMFVAFGWEGLELLSPRRRSN
jgi:hypothetical protein